MHDPRHAPVICFFLETRDTGAFPTCLCSKFVMPGAWWSANNFQLLRQSLSSFVLSAGVMISGFAVLFSGRVILSPSFSSSQFSRGTDLVTRDTYQHVFGLPSHDIQLLVVWTPLRRSVEDLF